MQTQHIETMDRMVEYRVQSLAASMDAAQRNSILWARVRVRLGRMLIHLGTVLDNECRELAASAESTSRQGALLNSTRACPTCA